MKREFTLNIILLIAINLLIKPVYIFGIDARIQNLVGTEDYGMYFNYFNFVFLFQFLNDPGIQNWNAQYVPKNRTSVGSYLPNLMKIKLSLAFIFVFTTLVFSVIAGYEDKKMIFFLCLNMVLSTLFMYFRGTISGLGFYRTDSFLSVLDKALMICILGYLAWISEYKSNFDISYLIYGQGLAYLFSCFIAGGILLSNVSLKDETLTVRYFKNVLKWSAPYMLILLFMTAYNKLDGVMLGILIKDNNYQVGVYATAYRFYDAANMIGYLFAALLLPMFAANADNILILKELKNIGLRFVVFSGTIIVLTLFFYGQDMLELLFDKYDSDSIVVLKILIISYLMVTIAYIFGTMLVACNKVRMLNILFGTGLILNFILNLILIPRYMAVGASVATLITQIYVMAGQVFLTNKELKVGIEGKEITRLIVYFMLSISIFFCTKFLPGTVWYVMLVISILFCVLLSFILKIIEKQEIINLLQKNR